MLVVVTHWTSSCYVIAAGRSQASDEVNVMFTVLTDVTSSPPTAMQEESAYMDT